MAWNELGLEEDEQLNAEEYSPYDLSVPDREGMDRILRRGIQGVKDTLKADPDPLFNQLELVPPGGRSEIEGGGALPTGAPQQNWQELEAPPPLSKEEDPEEDTGYFSNTVRLGADRALSLIGDVVQGAGVAGEAIEEKFDIGSLVWGDGQGARWVSRDELNSLREQGVSENLITETIPRAFKDVDLGGEQRNTPEEIKEAFNAGDVIGTAAAVVKFAGEQFITSIPDMIAVIYAMPVYVLARSSEMAEERVRNERLSEALAAGIDKQPGYVGGADVSIGDIIKTAPWATLSAMLERIGAKGIVKAGSVSKKAVKEIGTEATEAGIKAAIKAGGKAGWTEAKTEFFQEGVLEYLGEKLGTSDEGLFANVSVAEGAERGFFGALGGGIGGAGAGTTIAGLRSVLKPKTPAEADTGTGPDTPSGRSSPIPETDETGAPIDVDVSAESASMKVGEVDAALSAALDQQALDAGETVAPTETPSVPTQKQLDTVAPVDKDGNIVLKPHDELTEAEVSTEEKLESPMIDKKALKEKLRQLNTDEPKSIRAVRKAWRGVMESLVKRFPDTKLPLPQRTFGAPAIANFFVTLQEQVDLTQAMPELKEFLDKILTGTSAEVIDTLNRMTSSVIADIPSATVGETGKLSSQMVSGINQYDAAEETRLKNAKTVETVDKKTGKKKISKRVGGLANRLKARAIVVDELATIVQAGIDYLKKNGGLGLIPEGVTDLIARARHYREGSQVTKRRILPSGTVVEPKKFTGKNLDDVGGGLRDAADIIARVVASQELNKPKTGDTKVKVEETSSTTEAVTKSKMERSKKPKRNPLNVEELSEKETIPSKKERDAKREEELLAGTVETEKSLKEQRADLAKMKGEKAVEQKPQTVTEREGDERVALAASLAEKTSEDGALVIPPVHILRSKTMAELRDIAKKLSANRSRTKTVLIANILSQARAITKLVADATRATEQIKAAEAKRATKVQTKAEKAAEMSAKRAAAKKKRAAGKKPTKKQKETARVKAEIKKGQGDLAAAVKGSQKGMGMADMLTTTEEKKAGLKGEESLAANRKDNMDKLLALVASGDLVGLAFHFHNVGHGVSRLTKAERAKIAKALGAKVVPSTTKTIQNMMSAANDIKKEYRANKKKETVPGAKPEEVLEVEEKIVSGKQSKTELEKAGFAEGTSLTEALEDVGLSNKAARIIRGLVAAVKPKQRAKIIAAVHEYGLNADNAEAIIRLVAQITDITGKTPSQEILGALMEYGEARAQFLMEFKEDELQSDADREAIAEARGLSPEDSDFYGDELGYATSSFLDEEQAEMSEEDYKDRNFSEKSSKKFIVNEKDYDAGVDKIVVVKRHEFDSREEAQAKYLELQGSLTGNASISTNFKPDTRSSTTLAGRLINRVNAYREKVERVEALLVKLAGTDILLTDDIVTITGKIRRQLNLAMALLPEAEHAETHGHPESAADMRDRASEKLDKTAELFKELNRFGVDTRSQEQAVKSLQDREERGDPAKDTKEDKTLFRAMNKMKSFFADNIGKTVNISELLQTLVNGLPTNHRYHILAQRLLRLNMDMPVEIRSESEPILDTDGNQIAQSMGEFKPGKNLTEREIWVVFDEQADTHGELIERSLHEVLHAALWHAYRTNEAFRNEINTLYAETVAHFKREAEASGLEYSFDEIEKHEALDTLYGLKNPEEFMVEAMTNPDFQEKLAGIQSQIPTTYVEKLTNIMQRFKDAVNKYLGYSVRNNVLERVISAVSINLMSESDQVLADRQRRNNPYLFPSSNKLYSEKASPTTKRRESLLDARRRATDSAMDRVKSVAKIIKNTSHEIYLGWSARDVIERNQRKLFDKGAKALEMLNPMTRYNDAKASASSKARVIEAAAVKIIKRIVALDNLSTSRLFAAMRDITKAEIYADKPLNHPDNVHLWTTHKDGTVALKGKYAKTAPAARQTFIDLKKKHPKAVKLLVDMANLTKKILNTKREGTLIAMGEGFKFDAATIKSLRKVRTDADVDAMFPVMKAEDLTTLKVTVVETKAEKAKKKEQLAKAATNEAANKAAKSIINMTKIQGMYFPLRRYGNYVLSTHSDVKKEDAYVSFHTTQTQAEKLGATLEADGLEVNVSLKVEKNAVPKNIAAVIAEITKHVKDADTRLALRGALAETLAESVAYSSQMKRYNIDGIAADDMGRAFEEYVRVSKYTIGDLVTSHSVSRALLDMKTIQRNEDGALTVDEAIKVGQTVNEIAKQNKNEADERDPSLLASRVGLIGFLNFLGAPSYWALNSTQTLTITLPYVYSEYGNDGVTALFKAYGVVFEAVGKTFASGNPSYEMFVSNLPAAAQKVVKAMEDDTIIQSTLAHEFGNTFSPSAFKKFIDFAERRAGKTGKAVATTPEIIMFIMEKVPEAIEHFNRISTGLAIYDVSKGDYIAVKDGVQKTQFNYETSNRARLLKRWGNAAGRGLVSPIMMFKTHGLGVANLLYRAMFDVVYQKGKNRKKALRLAGGLITTHTLFGGVAGGFMLFPITILIGIFNMMFREAGDEFDLEEAVDEFGKEIGGDAIGALLARGIPAYFGGDVSNSINLGNLIWMGNDRADPSKPGEWAEIVYRQFGPLAQYVGNTVRESALYVSDDPTGSGRDFFEAAVPVKVVRGMLQAWKYAEEGYVTGGALELLSPDDFSNWDIALTAMGLQSSTKTTVSNWYYKRQAREMRRQDRRSVLIRKMVEAIDNGEDISGLIDEAVSFSLALPYDSDVNKIIPGADMARYRSQRREDARKLLRLEVTH